MAITIDQSFITQFGQEVKHSWQAETNILGLTRKRENVVGNTSRFQKLGAVAAYTKTRNADLTVLEPAHTYTDVTLADYYATVLVDDLDLLKTNVDIKAEYVKTVSRAIARKVDQVILAALAAGVAVPTTTTGAMTVARLLEVKKVFDNAEVPQADRKFVIGASAMEDLLGTTQVTSSDYNSVNALVKGDMKTFSGFEFATVPDSLLVLSATERLQLAFQKEALGVAIGANMKTFVEWSTDKHAWWIKAVASLGAGIVDSTGVLEIGVTS
jgi:hypothetical protein